MPLSIKDAYEIAEEALADFSKFEFGSIHYSDDLRRDEKVTASRELPGQGTFTVTGTVISGRLSISTEVRDQSGNTVNNPYSTSNGRGVDPVHNRSVSLAELAFGKYDIVCD